MLARATLISILAAGLNAEAMFMTGPMRRICPVLLTSVDHNAETAALVEPVFFQTLMQIGSDRDLTRWIFVGRHDGAKFKFIYATIKKITENGGLQGSVAAQELEDYLEDTLNISASTRQGYLGRMVTMKVVGKNVSGRYVIDPTLIYRIGILSGVIREKFPTDSYMKAMQAEERRFAKTQIPPTRELFWLRIRMYMYGRLLEEIPPEKRKRFNEREVEQLISKENPFGVQVLTISLNQMIVEGALVAKHVNNYSPNWGFAPFLSIPRR